MVTYSFVDIIPIHNFTYAWRITDKQRASLSAAVLQHILPISSAGSKEICRRGRSFRCNKPPYVNTAYYHVMSHCSLEGTNTSNEDRIQHWFRQLPIKGTEQLYISWGDSVAIITEWAIFTEIWDNLWYPFDAVDIFDETMDWAVLFGPEEFAVFLASGSVDSQTKAYSELTGYGLMRAPAEDNSPRNNPE